MKLLIVGVLAFSPTLACAQYIDPAAAANELLQQQMIASRKQHEINQLRMDIELRQLRRERAAQIDAERRPQRRPAADFGTDDPVIAAWSRSKSSRVICETVWIDDGLSTSHCHEP